MQKLRKKENEAIETFVNKIAKLHESEPLDGDGTEKIAKRVLKKLDFVEGNW